MTIQKEIADYDKEIKLMKESFPEVHSVNTNTKQEGVVQNHREGSCSLWRRIQTPDSNSNSQWFEPLREAATRRFEEERPLRSVIKRMSVIDEKIQLLFVCYLA